MLGTMLMILVIVWAIKEIAEGVGIADRIKHGKQPAKEEKTTEKTEE